MYPLKLQSVLKDIIWGGTTLSEKYGKGHEGQKIAEAWVLSCREDGTNTIKNGELAGKDLSCLYSTSDFPLLIKLIDARDKLSVQVHPDDEYAKKEGLPAGKTEMWYILDAAENAELVYGLTKDCTVSDKDIKAAAESGDLEKYLCRKKVKKGDVLFIPAGLVHAIGGGILIAEVQQNSNTTYRLYDYERKDKNGNRRELHIQKALEVINRALPSEDCNPTIIKETMDFTEKLLCKCNYFCVKSLELHGKREMTADKMLFALCTEGGGNFIYKNQSYSFSKGDGYLFPENTGIFSAVSDGCELLLASE